jgi:general secretion pathway protein N
MLALAAAAAAVGEGAGSAAPRATAPALQDIQVPAASKPDAAGNPLWSVSLDSLSATRERPLFSASRRPPIPPPPEIAPSPPPMTLSHKEPDHPRLVLVGTIVGHATDGQARDNQARDLHTRDLAVLLEEKTRGVIRLRPGQEHDGWALRRIGRREVTLEKENQIETLTLSASGADVLRSGPIQYAEHQPDAITRFAGPMPAPPTGVDRRCASGAAASTDSGNSALCALGRGRAQLFRK